MNSTDKFENIKKALSHSRMATYEKYAAQGKALELYCWNLCASSAILECIAVCEVVIRNAVSEALIKAYGENWYWNKTFVASLQHKARTALEKVTTKFDDIDRVIPELPFFFWQSLFTTRFDNKIWNDHLQTVLPNVIQDKRIRGEIFNDLERIRKLRNRIAHHEPIFQRNLKLDYDLIIKLICYRCADTAAWVQNWQSVDLVLKQKTDDLDLEW